MVSATKPAHDPATCRCPNCSCERALTDTGGWEWIDDGRETPIEPGRHPLWFVVDVAVLVLALAMLWLTLGGDGW